MKNETSTTKTKTNNKQTTNDSIQAKVHQNKTKHQQKIKKIKTQKFRICRQVTISIISLKNSLWRGVYTCCSILIIVIIVLSIVLKKNIKKNKQNQQTTHTTKIVQRVFSK